MNAVVKAGIGLVAIAGAGLGLGPYFIGMKGEEVYKAYLAEYAKHGFDVEIKHYNRTWFSASAEYQLTPNNQNVSFGTAEWRPLFAAITVKDEIQHGPLVPYKTGLKLGFFSFASEFAADQEKLKAWNLGLETSEMGHFKDMLLQGTQGKPMLQASGYVGFDQRFYSRLETASFNYQEDWGTLSFDPIIWEGHSDLAITQIEGHYAWKGFKFENTDQALSVTLDGLEGRDQSQYLEQGLWDIDGRIRLLPLSLQTTDAQVAWSAFDIDVSSHFQDQKGYFKAVFALKDLSVDEFKAEHLGWTLALNRLDVTNYIKVMDIFRQLNAETAGANPEMASAMAQRSLIEHQQILIDLFEGIGLNIKDVELKSNQGNLSAHLALDVGEIPTHIAQNPLLVINALSGNANLNFDKTLIPETQQEAIKMPVMMGFLKDENKTLTSTLTLKAGVLEVNGQQLPLGAMIAQNASSPNPTETKPETQTQPSLSNDDADETNNAPAIGTEPSQ